MYFNHAFHKMFIGNGPTLNPANPYAPNNPATTGGFITTEGIPTSYLSKMGPGYFGFFDPNTWKSVVENNIPGCCPLVLASASLLSRDKIGPFAGGYQESNKSKIIKPKHITRYYRVDSCEPQQNVISIGNTPYTDDTAVSLAITNDGACLVDGTYNDVPLTASGTGTGLVVNMIVSNGAVVTVTIVNTGTGFGAAETATPAAGYEIPVIPDPPCEGAAQPVFTVTAGIGANCCKQFLCDETYYIRIDVKGSPALRFLNHNAYWDVYYYTGCCNDQTAPIVPNFVDSTLVFIGMAEQIVTKPTLQNFIFPVVYDETGVAWFPPNSTTDPEGNAIDPAQWWSNYQSTGHITDACGGMRLFGAYVDTVFQNCTFQPTDFFMVEPLKILASEVDVNGDPCTFTGLCVLQECPGRQGMGFGDTIIKQLILSQSYLQNYVATDLRIREVTLGNEIVNGGYTNLINRTSLYTRYVILHNVPRYNNPSSTYDNDQYALEIITNGVNASFESFMDTWLTDCGDCVTLDTEGCQVCDVVPIQPAAPIL